MFFKFLGWCLVFLVFLLAAAQLYYVGHPGFGAAVFILGLVIVGPALSRAKKWAFTLGYTGTTTPTPDKAEEAERAERVVSALEAVHKIVDIIE